MKSKKTKKANIEKRKPTLLLIGLVLSLAMVLESFEWLGSENLGTGIESSLAEELAPENIMEVDLIKPKKEVIVPKKPSKTTSVAVVTKPIVAAGPVIIDPDKSEDPPIDWDAMDNGDDDGDVIVIEVLDSVHQFVEEMPEFPGGLEAMYKFMGDNIKYPQISAEGNSQGQAYVNFTVEKNGKITDVKILGGSADRFCKKEATRVVESMPKWKPGEQLGKKVRVSYTLPVRFVLD